MSLLASVTTAPPAGAAVPSVTVPVLPAGPVTVAGLTLTPASPAAGGFTVSVAVFATPSYVAVIVTAVTAVTAVVVIANVAVVVPAATVTDAGTVAALRSLLVSVTSAPPAGAAALSVTVPVLPAAPVTVAGLTLTPASPAAGGFTVSVAVFATPSCVAVIVTAVTAVTAVVVIANVAVVAPAATVTDAGTVAALRSLLVSVTSAPPAGAAVPSVTVPVLPAV